MSTLVFACQPKPGEQLIKSHIEAILQAIDERDNSAIMDFVSEQFRANNSIHKRQLDKMQLRRMIAGYFLRYKDIPLAVSNLSINVDKMDPYRATVSCHVLVTGRNNLLPEVGKFYSITAYWLKLDGRWLITRLEY